MAKSTSHMKLIVGLVAVAFVGWVSVPRAHAGATFEMSDGVSTVTVTDNGPGDSNPATGVIVFAPGGGGPFPGLLLTVNTGISKPVMPIPGAIDLNSIEVTSTSAGVKDFTLRFSDTGFANVSGSALLGLALGGTLTGPAGSSITFDGFEDNTDALFGTGGLHVGPLAFGPGAFSATQGVGGIVTSPYSLTEVVTIHFTGSGVTSFDAELRVVPEPATLTLLGLGLIGLGGCAWWRRRDAETPTR